MKFAIVIPARKGSRSIKNKNLIKLKNKPLIQYTFDQIKKINCLKFILSDSEKIKSIAKKNKINADYIRPKSTSLSITSMDKTIFHFAKWSIDKFNIDYVIILQPTSPLRSESDIRKSMNIMKSNRYKSLFSVSESLEHPYESVHINDKKKSWRYVLKKSKKFYRRQDFDINSYFINGAIYIIERNYLLKYKKIISNLNYYIKMNKSRSLDVNDLNDLYIAKKLL
tara:strand:- start:368 stop:1042 length:675 start_codon:yes stop_codon:yes gene_type:complete